MEGRDVEDFEELVVKIVFNHCITTTYQEQNLGEFAT